MAPGFPGAPFDIFNGLLTYGLIKCHLILFHLHPQCDLGPGRQFIENLRFDTTEHERTNEFFQLKPCNTVMMFLNRYPETGIKLFIGAEQTGIDKMKEVP